MLLLNYGDDSVGWLGGLAGQGTGSVRAERVLRAARTAKQPLIKRPVRNPAKRLNTRRVRCNRRRGTAAALPSSGCLIQVQRPEEGVHGNIRGLIHRPDSAGRRRRAGWKCVGPPDSVFGKIKVRLSGMGHACR